MDKRTKEVVQAGLNAEQAVMKELESVYKAALDAINERIKLLQTGEITQSTIYHIEYQKTLKAQISAILDKLQADEYTNLEKYLTDNYNIGFAGSAYAMHGQGVPVLMPIDKNAVYKAIVTDTKLTHPLYKEIGLDMAKLKKTVTHEISRGIASGLNYKAMARNIQAAAKIPQDRAKAIARTDGHRVLEASAEDARQAAKARGADVVKQWDATLDGNTRDTHRQLDGQIRETNEPFTLGSKSAMYPGSFGIPEEDCNCRCIATTRARWELDEDELNILKDRAQFFGLDKTKDFDEFKEKYIKAAETLKNEGKSGKIEVDNSGLVMNWKQFGKKIGKHAKDFKLDASSEADRQKMLDIITDIRSNATEQRIGYWRGQPEEVLFFIKGRDVVITKLSGEFITIMEGGSENERVKNARKR